MATIYSFGPFQLDDESEILFRGKTTSKTVDLYRILIVTASLVIWC